MKIKEKLIQVKDKALDFVEDHATGIAIFAGCTLASTLGMVWGYLSGWTEGTTKGYKYGYVHGEMSLSRSIRKEVPEAAKLIDDHIMSKGDDPYHCEGLKFS